MDYNRLKSTADRLISGFAQGVAETAVTVLTPDSDTMEPPTSATNWTAVDGAAFRGVSSQYVDGTTILATDLQGIVQADAAVAVGDFFRTDGTVRTIVWVDRIPAVGTVVAKRVFIRG